MILTENLSITSSAVGPHLNNLGTAGQTVQALRGKEFLEDNEIQNLRESLLTSDLPIRLANLFGADYQAGSRTALINTDWLVPRGLVDQSKVYTDLVVGSARKFQAATKNLLRNDFPTIEIYNALRPRLDDSRPAFITIENAKQKLLTKFGIDVQLIKEGTIDGTVLQTLGHWNEIIACYELLDEYPAFKNFLIPSFKLVYDKKEGGVCLPDGADALSVFHWIQTKGNIKFGFNCFTTTAWQKLQQQLDEDKTPGLKYWFYSNYAWHLPNVYDSDLVTQNAACVCSIDGQSGHVLQSENFIPDLVTTTQNLISPKKKIRIGGCCGSDSNIIKEFSQAVRMVTIR